MYFDQKGPFIFSASLHFAVLVFFLIKMMIEPEKDPEEFVFELMAPSAPGVETPVEPSVTYEPTPIEMPTPEEIPDPEPLPEPVIEETPLPEPEPVVEKPEPVVEAPPKVNFQDFAAQNPIKPQRIPKPKPTPQRNVNLDKQFQQLQQSLNKIDVDLPPSVMANISSSQASQDVMMAYFAALKQAIVSKVELHPLGAVPLETRVEFRLASNGRLSGARIVNSSGDRAFDQKVLDAFVRLAMFRPPPDWPNTESLTLTIKQRGS